MKKVVGSHLVIQITGSHETYIAEVTQEQPLCMKVEENGPLANLKDGDYIIMESLTEVIQGPDDACTALLRERAERGHPFVSGLRSLGINDDKLHEILPAE